MLVGLEGGILEYICGMLEETSELLESAAQLAEAIGPFLESSGFVQDAAAEALPYCERIVALLSKGAKKKRAKAAKAPRAKPVYSKGVQAKAKAGGSKAKTKGGVKGPKGEVQNIGPTTKANKGMAPRESADGSEGLRLLGDAGGIKLGDLSASLAAEGSDAIASLALDHRAAHANQEGSLASCGGAVSAKKAAEERRRAAAEEAARAAEEAEDRIWEDARFVAEYRAAAGLCSGAGGIGVIAKRVWSCVRYWPSRAAVKHRILQCSAIEVPEMQPRTCA